MRCSWKPAARRAAQALRGRRLQWRAHPDAEGRHRGGGADGAYKPLGAPRISYASPPYSGAYALKLAAELLDGKEVPHNVTLPLPIVTNETIKLCETGSWDEMKAGCNVFKPSIIANPGWFASIFSEKTRKSA